MLPDIKLDQKVVILIDGNNIEHGVRGMMGVESAMLDYDNFVPKVLMGRALNKFLYFREGKQISNKLGRRFHNNFFGSTVPCMKSADIPMTIEAVQLSDKVDTMIIFTGDGNFVELVRFLKMKGVRVEIAAVKETTSVALLRECDYYHFITPEDVFVLEPKPRYDDGATYYDGDSQTQYDNSDADGDQSDPNFREPEPEEQAEYTEDDNT